MILEFRTKRNVNGHCKYISIDTEKKIFARESHSWYGHDAIEIKTKDFNTLRDTLTTGNEFTEVERI